MKNVFYILLTSNYVVIRFCHRVVYFDRMHLRKKEIKDEKSCDIVHVTVPKDKVQEIEISWQRFYASSEIEF